ncbi:putative type I restriction enzyme, S subunit [Hollandina sp. SP2]
MICVSEHELAAILGILKKHAPDCEARAFGSRYKWTSNEYSDLDLALAGKAKLGLSRLGSIRDAFEESDLPFRVDVLDWHCLSKEFQAIINNGYEVIFTPNKKRKELWRKVRLGEAPLEIIDGDRGKNYPSQNDFFDNEYCLFLNTKNVRSNGFDFSVCQFITKERDKSLRKGKLSRNDTVLTTRGTVGNIAFYDDNVPFENVRINSGMVIIRPDETKLLPKFNYYLFRKLQGEFSVFTTGSAQPQLPIRDLIKLSLILPPLPIQRAIAATLSCLDDKIALNRRINANLEAQAQGIYEQFFCTDKQKGCLSDICRYNEERIAIAALTPETYISTENMLSGKAGYTDATSLPKISQTTKFNYGDVLVSNIRPYFKKIVYCNFTGGCSTDVLCFSATKAELSSFLYCTLYRDQFFDHMLAGSKGTKMPRGDKRQIMNYPVVIPNEEALFRFSNIVKPMLTLKYKLSNANHILESIRDALLPKLMSGEIEVET